MNRLAVPRTTALIVALGIWACDKDEKPTGPPSASVAPAGKVAALAAPTNLRVEAVTDTSARLRWDAVEAATDYDVNYKKAEGGRWTNHPHPGTTLHTTLDDLEPHTEYRWAVRAENSDGYSDWAFSRFTTLGASEDPAEEDSTLAGDSAEGPNLKITIAVPERIVAEGDPITLEVTVRNHGNSPAPASTISIYQHEDTTRNPTAGVEVATRKTDALAAGAASTTASVQITAPSVGLSSIIFYYYTCVTPVTGETNTDDNCAYEAVRVMPRGVSDEPFDSTTFDSTAVDSTAPWIYNDNVFVLPVSEDLAIGGFNLPLDEYSVRFYEYFSDAFDFLIFIPSMDWRQLDPEAFIGAFFQSVWDDVQGIGFGNVRFFDSSYGSSEKLRGVIHFDGPKWFGDERHSCLVDGPLLHELKHCWANYIISETPDPHWDFTSANGILGGFDIDDLENLGDGQYRAPYALTGGFSRNLKPYSPIELYLAGFIPPAEVPDLWVGEGAENVSSEQRGSVWWDLFTASRVRTYSIEDIIAEHGPRVPNHVQSQKDFRAAVILLVSDEFPARKGTLELLSDDASLFSYPGNDGFDWWYNFYEATGGRGTIAMDGLSQFKRDPGAAKRPALPSYGTPRPPIICHWH